MNKIICSDKSSEHYFYLIIGVASILLSIVLFVFDAPIIIPLILLLMGLMLTILLLKIIYSFKYQVVISDNSLIIRQELKTYKYLISEIDDIRFQRSFKLPHTVYITVNNKEIKHVVSKWVDEFQQIKEIIENHQF